MNGNKHFIYSASSAALDGMQCSRGVWEACLRSLNTRLKLFDAVYTLTDDDLECLISIESDGPVTNTTYMAARMYVTGYIAAAYEAAQAGV